MLKELVEVSHKASMKSCCDLSCCTDHPQFSQKKSSRTCLSPNSWIPWQSVYHRAPYSPQVWLMELPWGWAKEQEKGQEELCCCSGGPRASPVKREAGVRKSWRIWDGFSGDLLIPRQLTVVHGVQRSCLWVSSGIIWSSLTCAVSFLGTAWDSPLCTGFPCLKPKISFHKNSLQLKTKHQKILICCIRHEVKCLCYSWKQGKELLFWFL